MPSTSLCRTFTLTWVIIWLSLNCLLHHNLLFWPVVWITSVMCSLICFCQLLIPVTQQNTNYLICFFLFPEFLDPSLKMYTNNLHNTRYITEKMKRIKQRRLFIHPAVQHDFILCDIYYNFLDIFRSFGHKCYLTKTAEKNVCNVLSFFESGITNRLI